MTNELVAQKSNFDVSNDIEATQKMCAMLMKTKHFAKMGEEGIFAILCKARSMGLNPMDALNGQFYMVNGRLGMSSEMMANLIRKAGHSITKDKSSTDTCCVLIGKRADNHDTWTMKFSVEDAKRAGIYKNMWEKYPTSMCYNRCLSFLARQLFPDVIQGVSYTEDELKEDKRDEPNDSMQVSLDVEEVKNIISDMQLRELEDLLDKCPKEYKEKVIRGLSKLPIPIHDLKDLPLDLYDRVKNAAILNAKPVLSFEEIIDAETE